MMKIFCWFQCSLSGHISKSKLYSNLVRISRISWYAILHQDISFSTARSANWDCLNSLLPKTSPRSGRERLQSMLLIILIQFRRRVSRDPSLRHKAVRISPVVGVSVRGEIRHEALCSCWDFVAIDCHWNRCDSWQTIRDRRVHSQPFFAAGVQVLEGLELFDCDFVFACEGAAELGGEFVHFRWVGKEVVC